MLDRYSLQSHGASHIRVEGRLLVIEARGPWNQDVVQAAAREVLTKANGFGGRPWMVLGIVHGDGLHTPEATQEMVDSLSYQKTIGRSGTALVLKDVGIDGYFRNFFARMYAAAKEPVEFFTNEQAARVWLAERVKLLPNEGPTGTSGTDVQT